MAQLSAGDLATEGFRLMGRNKPAVAVWSVVYVLIFAASFGLLAGVLGPSFIGLMSRPKTADPAAIEGMIKPFLAAYVVLLPLGLAVQSMVITAVYRAALRPEQAGFFFLRFGADELRMMLVSFLLGLIALISLAIVIGLVAAAVVAIPGTGGKVLMGFAGGAAGLCLLAFIGVRLCMASPMTFAERRIHLFGSWRLTQGRFWPLLGAFFLALVLSIIASTFLQIVLSIIMSLSGGAQTTLVQGATTIQPHALIGLAPLAVAYLVVMAVSSLAQTILMLAPLAAGYRQIVGNAVATADTFA
jgi:hypothetical protein